MDFVVNSMSPGDIKSCYKLAKDIESLGLVTKSTRQIRRDIEKLMPCYEGGTYKITKTRRGEKETITGSIPKALTTFLNHAEAKIREPEGQNRRSSPPLPKDGELPDDGSKVPGEPIA